MHKTISMIKQTLLFLGCLLLFNLAYANIAAICAAGDAPPCISCTTTGSNRASTTTCDKSNFTQDFYQITIKHPTIGSNVLYKFCKAVTHGTMQPITYYYQYQQCDNTLSGITLTTQQDEYYQPGGNWKCDITNNCRCEGNNPAIDCPFTNKPF